MDSQQHIVEQVREAVESRTALALRGGGSKAFLGEATQGDRLELAGHSGVVDYDPGELVITCRAGVPLAEIRELLASNGQHLPFDPPAFGAGATIGGTVACGLSGPGRPWAGSLRDYLLGVKIVNGRGEVLSFGGQVMKNVAGYDVSRLMAGSMGTLGVILETSFKVLPRPAKELTLAFECTQQDAIQRIAGWSARPIPLSAASWSNGRLKLRLSGAAAETEKAARSMSPDECTEDMGYWPDLREHRVAFGSSDAPLWRLSLPAATPPLEFEGHCLLDWGGAQRWYSGPEPHETIRATVEACGGHATLFRGGGEFPKFHPLPKAMRRLQDRIRLAFDPHGLFNPGRMGPAA